MNLTDGKKLGKIIDVVFTICGKLLGIVAPGERRLFAALRRSENIFIPWEHIVRIGEDTILIELLPCLPGHERRGHGKRKEERREERREERKEERREERKEDYCCCCHEFCDE